MSILIVDDESDICRVLSMRLAAHGFEVETAASAKMAFDCLHLENNSDEESDIDLVMMDIVMPEISGIDACRMIKSHPLTEDVPVIMMTASHDMEHLEEAFDAGAMDYMTKPFNKTELMVRIGSALRLKKEIDQRKKHEKRLLSTSDKLKEVNAKLTRLSTLDGLTGLYNRRYFDDALVKEFQRAKRSHSPISLIMSDIDWFKNFNDRFGHQAGDDCLKTVATELKSVISRSHDLIARYGGEEFVIILPETPEAGAFELAEELRGHIEVLGKKNYASLGDPGVTISLGVAGMVPERDSEPEELIRKADEALYRSKRLGRNRVTRPIFPAT